MSKRLSELKLWELKHLAHLFLDSLAALKKKCFEEDYYQMQFYLTKGICVALSDTCCAARKEWHCASLVLLAYMLACTQHNTTMPAPLFSGIITGVKFTLYASVGENLVKPAINDFCGS